MPAERVGRETPAAMAFWFGPAESRCFGWYHAPVDPAGGAPRRAVVLCPPLGYELLSTYRAYKHLAQRLADRGFSVLRFDYPGTGNAPGSDEDPARVESWLAGVRNAIVEARRRSGAPQVCLFGTRLGASLATVVAAEGDEVDSLAMFAPCETGAAYLDDLRAKGILRGASAADPGREQAYGFLFRSDTLADIGSLDLLALHSRPSRRALIVPRDDAQGREAHLAEHLRALGADVDVRELPGYGAAISDDPYFVAVPERVWEELASWLGEPSGKADPRPEASSSPGAASVTMAAEGATIEESILRFGDGGRLFGILSAPASGKCERGVIILNTGGNPHIGSNRFGVSLSRRLAARGFAAFRIDLGGLGDSPPGPDARDNHLFAPHSIEDARAAVDVLCSRGIGDVVLLGLSSGGYVSFHAALADPRVRGLVAMNTLIFEWRDDHEVKREAIGGYRSSRYYGQTALRLDTWKRVLRGQVHVGGIAKVLARQMTARGVRGIKQGAVWVGLEGLVTTALARQFDLLLRRGTRVLVVFNGDEPMADTFETQLGALARRLRRRGLRVEKIDGADHVFGSIAAQRNAAALVCAFVDRS